jgi:hypothetical protein
MKYTALYFNIFSSFFMPTTVVEVELQFWGYSAVDVPAEQLGCAVSLSGVRGEAPAAANLRARMRHQQQAKTYFAKDH